MNRTTLTKLDFASALGLVAFAIAVLVESLRMPRLAEREINPYTAPGLVPGVLAAALLALGLVLLVRSILRGGWRLDLGRRSAAGPLAHPGLRRLGLALFLTFGYAAGLLGRLPFWAATFFFVLAFIALFEAGEPVPGRRRAVRLFTAAVQAALVAAAVTILFQELFLVRLP